MRIMGNMTGTSVITHYHKPVHLSYSAHGYRGGGVIGKFHRQSTQCAAMEMEALQLHLFDVVDKKQG